MTPVVQSDLAPERTSARGRAVGTMVSRREQVREALAPMHLRVFKTQDVVVRKWLLVAVPTLAAFGPLLPVVRPFYAFRLVAIALVLAAVLGSRRQHSVATTGVGRVLSWTAVVWLVSGFAGLVWAADRGAAFGDLLSIVCGLSVALVAVRSGPARDVIRWVSRGWVVAFVITGIVAVIEVTAHKHFSNYVLAPYLKQGRGEELAASTFGNPNGYALFLAMGAPILLYLVSASRSPKQRAGYLALVLWLLALLVYSGGRLGMAAALLSIVVWFACTRRALFSAAGAVVVAGVAVVLLSVWHPLSVSLLPGAPVKISETTVQELVPTAPIATATPEPVAPDPATPSATPSPTPTPSDSSSAEPTPAPTTAEPVTPVPATDGTAANSGNVRVNLARNGWDMLLESHGLGVGPGNFASWLKSHGEKYPVAGVYSPHNAVLELATQYGALAALFVFALFVVIVRSALRLGLRPRGSGAPAAVLVLGAAAGLPLAALCSSSFWDTPSTWGALTVLLLAAGVCEQARVEAPAEPGQPVGSHS